jgi:hypothetical protein
MAAALAALPDGGALLDEDITDSVGSAPAPVVDTSEYYDDEEGTQRVEVPAQAQAQAAAGAAPGAAPTTPPQGARPSADSQPVAPASGAAPSPAAAPGGAQAAPDPWAETEDIEYTDPDNGETYRYRVPKGTAEKAKGYITRRSVMDRNIGWIGRHRSWIEPLVTNQQFDSVAPVIERGLNDQEFANFIASAYQRRLNGLPLDVSAFTQQRQEPAQQAQTRTQAPGGTPAGGIDPAAILASIDGDDSVDEYTRAAFKKLAAPILAAVQHVNAGISAQETERAHALQAQQARQQTEAQQRATGVAMRRALMETFPDEYTATTPGDKFVQVFTYAQNSGIFQRYGTGPAAVVLAAQAMRSPNGLVSLSQRIAAPSVAAQTVADVRAEGERLAAEAANAVAHQTSSGAPSGAAPAATARPIKVPRFVKDSRTGKPRALTPKEVGNFLARYPNATV